MNKFMKKVLLFCAAMVAAMNMSATITEMTCAQAKQYVKDNLLNSGDVAEDSVAVTGYVTKDYSGLSRKQQRFSMDDVRGTTETLHCYFANMPEGEAALNVGDKVTVKGKLMNYNGGAQIKYGDVAAIIERISVDIDTLESTVCDVIEEGEYLNDGDKTTDYFTVEAVVTSIKTPMNSYNQESFWMTCETNEKQLQAYNLEMEDGVEAMIGDKVFAIGKIQKYGTTIELVAGTAKVIEKGDVKVDTISVNVAQAIEAGMLLDKGQTSVNVYIVEGYADSIAYAFSEEKQNMSFFMCDDMSAPAFDFEAYNVTTEKEVTLGTKVYVMGNLYHYYKAAIDDKPEINLIEISKGTVYFENPLTQSVEAARENKTSVKLIENGQLVIIRDGVKYNALGTVVK